MHAARKKTSPLDTAFKNGIQQKRHSLMLFENNWTLQKWHKFCDDISHKLLRPNQLLENFF